MCESSLRALLQYMRLEIGFVSYNQSLWKWLLTWSYAVMRDECSTVTNLSYLCLLLYWYTFNVRGFDMSI